MTNLLSATKHQQQNRERVLRLIVVVLGFLLASIVIGIVFLIPAGILSYSKKMVVEQQLTKLRETIDQRKARNKTHDTETLKEILDILSSEQVTTRFTDIVATIVDAKPAGVLLRSFANADTNTEQHITISGIASTRETLIQFADNLKKTSAFATVDLPVHNLAQNTDIAFSLELQMAPDQESSADKK